MSGGGLNVVGLCRALEVAQIKAVQSHIVRVAQLFGPMTKQNRLLNRSL